MMVLDKAATDALRGVPTGIVVGTTRDYFSWPIYRVRDMETADAEEAERYRRLFEAAPDLLDTIDALRTENAKLRDALEDIIGEYGMNGSIERARAYFDSHKGEG